MKTSIQHEGKLRCVPTVNSFYAASWVFNNFEFILQRFDVGWNESESFKYIIDIAIQSLM